MKRIIYLNLLLGIMTLGSIVSCEDFVEIDAPTHKIISEDVFSSDDTAIAAMTGIYNQLSVVDFSNGWTNSITMLAGLSADNLECIRTTNLSLMEFQQNEILPENTRNQSIWSSAYNIIYQANSLLEGIERSQQISEDVKRRLEGEVKFVRAFTYFYLVNLYEKVPLLLTTDYQVNALASSNAEEETYQQLIKDLLETTELLGANYINGERTYVNRFVAMALLARIYLYQENWEQAEYWSSQIIAQTNKYELLQDMDKVFLMNSKEAIWQISPLGRDSFTYTFEGYTLIIDPILSFLATFKLSEGLVASFELEDQRLANWVNFHSGLNAYYAYKYKDRSSNDRVTEYSMVLRMAEQYLIRAEARSMQNNLSGAIADIDIIRGRAGLELIGHTDHPINKEALLQLIMEERRKELFTEWGHRWLDLKRTGRAAEILGSDNPTWQNTDVLYPIPEEERIKNPNLDQNIGY